MDSVPIKEEEKKMEKAHGFLLQIYIGFMVVEGVLIILTTVGLSRGWLVEQTRTGLLLPLALLITAVLLCLFSVLAYCLWKTEESWKWGHVIVWVYAVIAYVFLVIGLIYRNQEISLLIFGCFQLVLHLCFPVVSYWFPGPVPTVTEGDILLPELQKLLPGDSDGQPHSELPSHQRRASEGKEESEQAEEPQLRRRAEEVVGLKRQEAFPGQSVTEGFKLLSSDQEVQWINTHFIIALDRSTACPTVSVSTFCFAQNVQQFLTHTPAPQLRRMSPPLPSDVENQKCADLSGAFDTIRSLLGIEGVVLNCVVLITNINTAPMPSSALAKITSLRERNHLQVALFAISPANDSSLLKHIARHFNGEMWTAATPDARVQCLQRILN